MWFVFALLSAVFAALTSVLAKVGIDGVNSNLATALRTCVVLAMAWLMVFIPCPKRNRLYRQKKLGVPYPIRPCNRCVMALLL